MFILEWVEESFNNDFHLAGDLENCIKGFHALKDSPKVLYCLIKDAYGKELPRFYYARGGAAHPGPEYGTSKRTG